MALPLLSGLFLYEQAASHVSARTALDTPTTHPDLSERVFFLTVPSRAMSALGQKQTFGTAWRMSALPPIADMLEGDILLVMWHTEPKNDDWREVHLARVESLGYRLWLRCNSCGHSLTPAPREFAQAYHLDLRTPLLSIAKRLK